MAAAWGSALTLVKSLTERVPVLDFMAVRFGVAGVVLILVAPTAVARLPKASRRRGIALGVVWGSAQLIHMIGLGHTDASVSGFIAGLSVVVTPVLAWLLLGHRLSWTTRVGVCLATIGLAVLGLRGFSLGIGELLTAVAALLYGTHILGLSLWSKRGETLGMATLQVLVTGFLYLVAAAPRGITTPGTTMDWLLLLYLATAIAAGGLFAQTWAQARLSPTRSALILTSEPVFAAGFAIGLGGDELTVRLVIGGTVVFCAILLTEAGRLLSSRRELTSESAGFAP